MTPTVARSFVNRERLWTGNEEGELFKRGKGGIQKRQGPGRGMGVTSHVALRKRARKTLPVSV